MTLPSRRVTVAAITAGTVLGVVLLVGSLDIPIPMLSIDVELSPSPNRARAVTRADVPAQPVPATAPPSPPLADPTEPLLLGRGDAMGMNEVVGYQFGERIPTSPRRPWPPATAVAIGSELDMLTPVTVRPRLMNGDDLVQVIAREFPAELRDAGIGGVPVVWVHVDRSGAVDATLMFATSGYEALDQAALRVARTMVFTPARTGEDAVTTWVELPIRFKVVN
jgi:protein TonB